MCSHNVKKVKCVHLIEDFITSLYRIRLLDLIRGIIVLQTPIKRYLRLMSIPPRLQKATVFHLRSERNFLYTFIIVK